MDLAGYVINAVLVEGRNVKEVCESHDISRSWLYELIARFREFGDDGLKAQSKRPRSSPTRVAVAVEDEIVGLRKELSELGVDAGPHTIHYHLQRRHRRRRPVPSVATIWRVLSRRGFVTPQPQKRPKSSWRRFQAELPNECWQADTTHWALADGSDVEILNVLDDHSRLLVASRAFVTAKAADVVETFHQGASELGVPASMLTDNGAIFTAEGPSDARSVATMSLALRRLVDAICAASVPTASVHRHDRPLRIGKRDPIEPLHILRMAVDLAMGLTHDELVDPVEVGQVRRPDHLLADRPLAVQREQGCSAQREPDFVGGSEATPSQGEWCSGFRYSTSGLSVSTKPGSGNL